jgi:hypothetical protein
MSGRGAKDPRKTLTPTQRRRMAMDLAAKGAGSRRTTAEGAIGAMMAITPFGMAKAILVPVRVGKNLVKRGAAKVASTSAAKAATKAPKALVSKLKKVKNPEKGFDPNKPFVLVKKGKKEVATNKIPPSKVSKIAKATPDKPMSRPEKIARVAAGQGKPTNVRTGSRRKPGLNLQDKKTGKLTGVSKRDQRIGKGIGDFAGPASRVAGIVAVSGDKKLGPKPAAAKKTASTPTLESAPRPKLKKPTRTKKQELPKPVDSGRKAYNKGFETMKEYFVDDMSGRKSRVKTPFGTITIDSSDKGMAFEEYESKFGGQIKGTVKRRMGGKVRGFGKALRGY